MATELSKWTFNARKWREENGFTTPEWEMYVANRAAGGTIISTVCFIIGILVGYVWV